jgi:hypothetical protein
MLYEYLLGTYKPGEPIFISDVSLPGVSGASVRQSFKTLADCGDIVRYETGVYYLPSGPRGKEAVKISPSIVAKCKYISRNGQVFGFYSGSAFANLAGVNARVPFIKEITTNFSGGKYREIQIKGQRFILRKPKAKIDASNASTLQFLDLLRNLGTVADLSGDALRNRLINCIMEADIKKDELDEYIHLYPDAVYRAIYAYDLYEHL